MWHASYPILRGQTQVFVHEHQVMRQSMWQPTMLQVDKWTPEDESNCCGCLEFQPGTSPAPMLREQCIVGAGELQSWNPEEPQGGWW